MVPLVKGFAGIGGMFFSGGGTLLGEIVLHATALPLRSNATVLGAALLTLALPSAGVFEGLLSKRISPRSCALTNGDILQLGGADACRLIVVRRAGEAAKILICVRFCAWQMRILACLPWESEL